MKVACVMCTWEEKEMVPLAIESSKDFVDRYVVVDKASEDGTADIIKECMDKWNLNMDIYIKPDLLLRQARMFAVGKVDEEWILIQDGDEVFHTDGPNSIFNLKKLLKFRNVVFCTPMTVLASDFLHTRPPYIQRPHPFLYHNNHMFYPKKYRDDLPGMVGVRVYLSRVYKFNCCNVKSPKRQFLRLEYWEEWCIKTNAFKEYRSVEEYAKAKLGMENLDEYARKWCKRYYKNVLKPYDEKEYGYYPKVIREYIRRGKIRGYEKN